MQVMQETRVPSLDQEGNGNPLQYSCLEKFHRPRNLVVYGPWGCKESDMTKQSKTKKSLNCIRASCLGGFPGGTSGKEPVCQCKRLKRCGFDPWFRKIPWRWAWQPPIVFLPGESHGEAPGGLQTIDAELDMTEVAQHTCTHLA